MSLILANEYFISAEKVIKNGKELSKERLERLLAANKLENVGELLEKTLSSFGDTDAKFILFEQSVCDSRRIEGYWKSDAEPYLPMPKANVLSIKEATEIYALMRIKEAECENRRIPNCKMVTYRGPSFCRLGDGDAFMGGTEYEHSQWKWPGDFGSHYVNKHRVKPSDGFLKFIGYIE